MDLLLKDYKNTKQTVLKKLKNKEKFWKSKENFIKNFDSNNLKNLINIPGFNNITNIFKSIPNPISNISNISNFAGSLGSSLKNKIYGQTNNTKEEIDKNKTLKDSKNISFIFLKIPKPYLILKTRQILLKKK